MKTSWLRSRQRFPFYAVAAPEPQMPDPSRQPDRCHAKRRRRQSMNLHSVHTDLLQGVKSELNYLAPTRERPRTYTYDPPVGIARTTVVNDPHQVVISDARPLLSQVSLDEEGFALVRHKSATRDFYDDVEVKRVYYPEAEQLLKEITRADRVFIFDHTVRRRVPGSEDRRGAA